MLHRTRARVARCVLRPDSETLSKESSWADMDEDEEATPGAYAASRGMVSKRSKHARTQKTTGDGRASWIGWRAF